MTTNTIAAVATASLDTSDAGVFFAKDDNRGADAFGRCGSSFCGWIRSRFRQLHAQCGSRHSTCGHFSLPLNFIKGKIK